MVSGNTVNNNTATGITLDTCLNNAVIGNTARNNTYYGIWLYGSDYNTVSGNFANNNSLHGINLGLSNNNEVLENTANYNQIGVYLNSSDVNSISGNTLLGNNKCIVEENSQGNIFSDNGDCTYGESEDGRGNPIELIILISVISGGAVIGVITLLLLIRKRRRIKPQLDKDVDSGRDQFKVCPLCRSRVVWPGRFCAYCGATLKND